MQILLDLQSSLPALGNYVYGLFGFFVPSFFGVGVFAFCLVWFGLVLLLWAFDAFCIVELCTFDSVTGRSGNNASAEIPVRRGMCGHTCGAGTPVVWALTRMGSLEYRYAPNRNRARLIPVTGVNWRMGTQRESGNGELNGKAGVATRAVPAAARSRSAPCCRNAAVLEGHRGSWGHGYLGSSGHEHLKSSGHGYLGSWGHGHLGTSGHGHLGSSGQEQLGTLEQEQLGSLGHGYLGFLGHGYLGS